MRGRPIIAGIAALAAGALVVANATVRERPEGGLRLIGKPWPGHPQALRASAFAGVGAAAARGQEPDHHTLAQVRKLAYRAPLEPEPFLVHGALAERRGAPAAEPLIKQARLRDPRSVAARFLLADMYLRRGDVVTGLRELSVLTKLLNGPEVQLVPGLAAYARTPGAVPKLKEALRTNPALQPVLLSALAGDSANADLMLSIWTAAPGTPADSPLWQTQLLQTLIADKKYGKAHEVWTRLSQVRAAPSMIYRPDFATTLALPPFNWTLAERGGGIAEPLPGGGLHVLYYGREDVSLAQQMTVLPPGRYELSFPMSGDVAKAGQLSWSLRCLPAETPLLNLALRPSEGRIVKGQFAIPPIGCEAQRLELKGVGKEIPESSDVTIGTLQLRKVAG